MTAAKDYHPDLIITDLMMPEMDGYEMLRQLRQIPELEAIPAIASSASVFESNRNESLIAGADAFLPKPIEASVLLKVLEKYLNLEWLYDQPFTENKHAVSDLEFVPLPSNVIVPPPDEVLIQLHTLTRQGRLMAIEQQLKTLEKADERYKPFIQNIRQYADDFQADKIRLFLEDYLPAAKA